MEKDKLIVAIDVGIVCLALAWVTLPLTYKMEKTDGFVLTDLTKITKEYHRYLDDKKCPYCLKILYKKESKNLYDRLIHFFGMYDHILSRADRIFVEYQPLQGHKAVEQIIYGKYREKIEFVHPLTLQCYFLELKNKTYEERKKIACDVVKPIIDLSPDRDYFYHLLAEEKKKSESYLKIRAHDIADAVLILKYGIEKRLKDEYIKQKQKEIFKDDLKEDTSHFFKKFLFNDKNDVRPRSSFLKNLKIEKFILQNL